MYHAACNPCLRCPATHAAGIIAGVLLASLTSPLAHLPVPRFTAELVVPIGQQVDGTCQLAQNVTQDQASDFKMRLPSRCSSLDAKHAPAGSGGQGGSAYPPQSPAPVPLPAPGC